MPKKIESTALLADLLKRFENADIIDELGATPDLCLFYAGNDKPNYGKTVYVTPVQKGDMFTLRAQMNSHDLDKDVTVYVTRPQPITAAGINAACLELTKEIPVMEKFTPISDELPQDQSPEAGAFESVLAGGDIDKACRMLTEGRGGTIMYDYTAYRNNYAAVTAPIAPPKSNEPPAIQPAEDHPDKGDEGLEHDTAYSRKLKGQKTLDDTNVAAEIINNALKYTERTGDIDKAVYYLNEGVLSSVVSRLRQLLRMNGVNPLRVAEEQLLKFIRNTRLDYKEQNKDETITKFAEEAGVTPSVAERLYTTVRQEYSFA